MESGPWPCSWWKLTDRYGPSREGVSSPFYQNMSTGEEVEGWGQLPIGALVALDYEAYQKGSDGLAVTCKLPDGRTWYIDMRASNCTKPNDNVHRCWVRHGTVAGALHVDKNGNTCAAGAGSIDTTAGGTKPGWHGYLHNHQLVNC